MRLKILVKRWGLPDAPIVLGVDTQTSPIISQLLEQINDIIPLESGEWGLEDYAVELKGTDGDKYECLHFNPVKKIMRDEDEVIVRPLSTLDIKVRKSSGRFQITSAGQHIVDGVVFGRPLLRRVERPEVKIPPRKKRCITFGEFETDKGGSLPSLDRETPDDIEDSEKQLILHGELESEDDEDDEDFKPGEDVDDDEDSSEDKDMDIGLDKHKLKELTEEDTSAATMPQSREDKLVEDFKGQSTQAKLYRLKAAFPDSPYTIIRQVFEGSNRDETRAYEALACGFQPTHPKRAAVQNKKVQNNSLRSKTNSNPISSKRRRESDEHESEWENGDKNLIKYYDRNGLPAGTIGSGAALSFMAEASKSSGRTNQVVPCDASGSSEKIVRITKNMPSVTKVSACSSGLGSSSGAIDSSSEEESDLEASDTSSSGTSSEGETEEDTSEEEDSSADSSESSGDENDDAPEESSSKATPTTAMPSKLDTSQSSKSKTQNDKPKTPPGQGQHKTRSRNQRRKKASRYAKCKELGILPATTAASEVVKDNTDELISPRSVLAALKDPQDSQNEQVAPNPSANAEDFEAQRQKLLAFIEDGGVDVEQGSSKDTKASKIHESPKIAGSQATKPPLADHTSSQPNAEPSGKALRKSTLDINASRRMLFGAMGLRAPKSKEDEDKLRSDVMKGVKDYRSLKLSPEILMNTNEEDDEDLDAWREVITYTAVECCQNGVTLSEPPFPFVQRWDPQQQSGWPSQNFKSGKRKKSRRDQTQFYQNDQRLSKRQKLHKNDGLHKSRNLHSEAGNKEFDQEANQHLVNDIPEPLVQSSQETDDILPLPKDVSNLPVLADGQAKSGMIIAFKQLILSEATKWQPEISAFCTARVIEISHDGELSLVLANRDQQKPLKKYDEMGARIYGKFEVADEDFDSLEEQQPNSLKNELVVAFSDMIEPKIVASEPTEPIKTVGIDSTVCLEGDSQLQFSHVSETPFHSNSQQELGEIAISTYNKVQNWDEIEALLQDQSRYDASHRITPLNESLQRQKGNPEALDKENEERAMSDQYHDLLQKSQSKMHLCEEDFDKARHFTARENFVSFPNEQDSSTQSQQDDELKEIRSTQEQGFQGQEEHATKDVDDTEISQNQPLLQTEAETDSLDDSWQSTDESHEAQHHEEYNAELVDQNLLEAGVLVKTSQTVGIQDSTLLKYHSHNKDKDELSQQEKFSKSKGSDLRSANHSPAPATKSSSPMHGSPGDPAVFNKLMRGTAAKPKPNHIAFSKYTDRSIGNSHRKPLRTHSTKLATPMKNQPHLNSAKILSLSPSKSHLQLTSPAAASSTWETCGSDEMFEEAEEGASTPLVSDKDDSWFTIDTDPSSTDITAKLTGKKFRKILLPIDARIDHEHSQGHITMKSSPTPSEKIRSIEEHDNTHYLKLSVGSSFSSHVTDHGRQPDYNFDESTNSNQLSAIDGRIDDSNDHGSNAELKLHQLCPNKHSEKPNDFYAEEASSSDYLPTLQELSSQLKAKSEKNGKEIGSQNFGKVVKNASEIKPEDPDEQSIPNAIPSPLFIKKPLRRSQTESRASKKSASASQSVQSNQRKLRARAQSPQPSASQPSRFQNQKILPPTSQVISLLSSDDDLGGRQEDDSPSFNFGVKPGAGWMHKKSRNMGIRNAPRVGTARGGLKTSTI